MKFKEISALLLIALFIVLLIWGLLFSYSFSTLFVIMILTISFVHIYLEELQGISRKK
ncbi:MAG: hypothetical protein ACNS62_14295 [Candidatus Cyclobacteriaceae bacterium M3_2C_046]